MARDFVVRDGDTLYVPAAPITSWNKTIAAFTGTLTSADTIGSLGGFN
jgi:polysaccharide export outer membrane protein